jgi:hypothetical protein
MRGVDLPSRQSHVESHARMLANAMASANERVVISSVVTTSAAGEATVPGSPHSAKRRSKLLERIFRHPPSRSPLYSHSLRTVALHPPRLMTDATGSTPAAFADTDVVQLSFSSMFEYNWCPARYYFRRIACVPTASVPALTYGSGKGLAAPLCVMCSPTRWNPTSQHFMKLWKLVVAQAWPLVSLAGNPQKLNCWRPPGMRWHSVGHLTLTTRLLPA